MKHTKKVNRKGQLQMTETIAILFIFFVLLLFGVIFYFRYQKIALQEKQEELLGTRAMESTLKTLFMSELICSRGEAEPEDNCFDVLKLNATQETMQKYLDEYYFEIFSYATITVQETYPENKTWILYDKQKPDFTRKEPTFFVVTLKDELAGDNQPEYGFGYVAVTVYS
ncbi:MAG TPA: hypothetical protein VJB13_03755 [Candidatus Nanoarchaeia archaeon]|nr:hypothetical protein [Candidatus Nanoarchaeia archaeon]